MLYRCLRPHMQLRLMEDARRLELHLRLKLVLEGDDMFRQPNPLSSCGSDES